MTSQNTINYQIFDKNGKNVGSHRQNLMCLRCNDGLLKFQPAEYFTIEFYDEDYDSEREPIRLDKWLLENKAQFTFKNFEKEEKVRVLILVEGKKKRVEATIVERFKGKWTPFYTIKLTDGSIIEDIGQDKILPL